MHVDLHLHKRTQTHTQREADIQICSTKTSAPICQCRSARLCLRTSLSISVLLCRVGWGTVTEHMDRTNGVGAVLGRIPHRRRPSNASACAPPPPRRRRHPDATAAPTPPIFSAARSCKRAGEYTSARLPRRRARTRAHTPLSAHHGVAAALTWPPQGRRRS